MMSLHKLFLTANLAKSRYPAASNIQRSVRCLSIKTSSQSVLEKSAGRSGICQYKYRQPSTVVRNSSSYSSNHVTSYSLPNVTNVADSSSSIIRVSPEVKEALSTGKPVVALESTIYTHGFPYPENVTLALDLEEILRQRDCVPATIGIVDGVAIVGLSTEELKKLASSAGQPGTMKVSRRDIPYILGTVWARF
jgi:hypothetical protein